MMNPEEQMQDGQPMAEGESPSGGGGHTICTNCYDNGTYDVFTRPLISASEQDDPDGIFGLESHEEALKANIALKQQGPDYASAEEEEMMQGYGAGKADGEEMNGE